jgi:hypothetical protein
MLAELPAISRISELTPVSVGSSTTRRSPPEESTADRLAIVRKENGPM